MKKRKSILIASILVLLVVVVFVGGILFFEFKEEKSIDELYTFPISVGEKTYFVSVLSNYSSAPEVSYWEIGKSVLVDFWGLREYAFCNITIPTDLIWGELSVIHKIYTINEDRYIQSSNGTHNSIYFTFNHTATTKHFEVVGAHGATTNSN